MALRRTSYVIVLGLAYQSYRFKLATDHHLLEMADAARNATTLESEYERNSALSTKNSDQSAADKLESESIHERVVALEAESERHAAAAESAHASSVEFASKAGEEESQAEIRETAAAADEVIYDTDMKKALAEAAEAAEIQAKLETDSVSTGACGFIPGLHFMCDLVGGSADVRMQDQTSAAKWSAKSALDTTAAATAKEQENMNLAASATLHVQAGEDSNMSVELQNKAVEEQARSDEAAGNAKEGDLKANAKNTESKEEEALSKEEKMESDSGEVTSNQWWEKSLMHGLAAFWDAILAGLVSLMAFLFFIVRACVTVLVPSVTELTNYLPLVMMLPSERGYQKSKKLTTSAWGVLRQISYFYLHCGTFLTGIITYITQFEAIEKVDTRSKGGIILMFTLFVASLQSFLLHVLPQYRNIKKEATSLAMSYLCAMWRGSCVFFCAVAHLVPLILMETLSLWIIFGHGVFSPNLPKNTVPYIIGLLFFTFVHIYIFEREEICTQSQTSADYEYPVPYSNSTSYSDTFVDNNEALNNERDSLLHVTMKDELVQSDLLLDGERYNITNGSDGFYPNEQRSTELLTIYNFGYQDGYTQDNTSPQNFSTENQTLHIVGRHEDLRQDYKDVDSDHDDEVDTLFDSSRRILQQVSSITKNYFSVLQFPFEVLVMCCMFTLLKSSIPTCKRLWPIFCKDFIGSHQHLYILSIGVAFFTCVGAFLWCVYSSSKRKSSNVHIGLFTGESVRTTIQSILSNE